MSHKSMNNFESLKRIQRSTSTQNDIKISVRIVYYLTECDRMSNDTKDGK